MFKKIGISAFCYITKIIVKNKNDICQCVCLDHVDKRRLVGAHIASSLTLHRWRSMGCILDTYPITGHYAHFTLCSATISMGPGLNAHPTLGQSRNALKLLQQDLRCREMIHYTRVVVVVRCGRKGWRSEDDGPPSVVERGERGTQWGVRLLVAWGLSLWSGSLVETDTSCDADAVCTLCSPKNSRARWRGPRKRRERFQLLSHFLLHDQGFRFQMEGRLLAQHLFVANLRYLQNKWLSLCDLI